MLDVLIQPDLFGEIILIAVDHHADITAAPCLFKYLCMRTFPSADNRRENLNLSPLRQRHHGIHHLVNRLPADLPPALRAVRDADARKKQTEIVIYLRHGADGRPRIAVCRLLVDGNSRRQAADIVHVRLVHLSEELPRIGRERFHVAPLSFRVNGIKRERGFARSAQAGHDDQLIARYPDIDVPEIILPRTPYINIIFAESFYDSVIHEYICSSC